ncbi:MAG TPA: Spy/CpxP family protein refolding chaperone, partial [Thermoanaerobaculia bacterium]|nr:Spy/CpxP family protein refolding chaperone [Thermoanaerobaculia bacterium]
IVYSSAKETDAMKRFAIRQLAPAMALLFALGATLASAQDAPHRHGKMGGFGLMRGLSRLDLTESQKADVQRIMESKKVTFESLRERNRADWEALQAAADAPSPNASEVGAAYLKVRAGREAMRAEHKATMEQIRSLLTAEQKEQLDTMIQKRQQRREGRHGTRGGFGR